MLGQSSVTSCIDEDGDDDEMESVFISGNLNSTPRILYDSDFDDEIYEEEEFEDCIEEISDDENIQLAEIEKADKILVPNLWD